MDLSPEEYFRRKRSDSCQNFSLSEAQSWIYMGDSTLKLDVWKLSSVFEFSCRNYVGYIKRHGYALVWHIFLQLLESGILTYWIDNACQFPMLVPGTTWNCMGWTQFAGAPLFIGLRVWKSPSQNTVLRNAIPAVDLKGTVTSWQPTMAYQSIHKH